MTLRDFVWMAIGMNVGVFVTFGLIGARFGFWRALALANELVRWLESQ